MDTAVHGLGLRVFKAHRLVYHSTLGSRVIKKKKKVEGLGSPVVAVVEHPLGFRVWRLEFRV